MIRFCSTPIKLLVTDLDNTLYDWVGFFVPAFYAMIERASEILDIDTETLLDQMRIVHQRHGSCEHPFSLLETDIVSIALKDMDVIIQKEMLDDAFYQFNKVRKNSLKTYDGVDNTLQTLVDSGIRVVGYTDARIPNSLYRVNYLGLDRYLTCLYAPKARHKSLENIKMRNEDILYVLPENDRKPNPRTLLHICEHLGVSTAETLYVGDSLSRDILMANSASIRSVWAKYGTRVDPVLWKKLVRITHWTSDDIEADALLKVEAARAHPAFEINSFAEILNFFDIKDKLEPMSP